MVVIYTKDDPKLICAKADRFKISKKGEVAIYHRGDIVFIGALQPLDLGSMEVKDALIRALSGVVTEFKEV